MASWWPTTITATTNGKNLSRKVSSKIGLMLHLVIVERSPCKAIMRRKKYGSAILKLKSYRHHIAVSTNACNSLVPNHTPGFGLLDVIDRLLLGILNNYLV